MMTISSLRMLLTIVVVVFLATCPLGGRAARIGLLHSAISVPPQNLQNTVALLSQNFSSVEAFNATLDTPSASWMNSHDAILVISGSNWNDKNLIGTRLADYIGNDGRVVVGSVYEIFDALGGSWTNSYRVLLSTDATWATNTVNISSSLFPNHPLTQGLQVDGIPVSDVHHPPNTTEIASEAYRVLDWADGSPLIAARSSVGPFSRNRVDLGFYPVAIDDGGWLSGDANDGGSDLYHLTVRALEYVLRNDSYMCTGEFSTSKCPTQVPDLSSTLGSYSSDFLNTFTVSTQTPAAGSNFTDSVGLEYTVTTPQGGSVSCAVNLVGGSCSSAAHRVLPFWVSYLL